MKSSRRRNHRPCRWKAGFAGILSIGLLVSPVGAVDDHSPVGPANGHSPAGTAESHSPAGAAEGQDQPPHASIAATEPAPPATGAINPITQAAVASGVLACAARVDQVAKFLTAGVPGNFWLFLPEQARDQHIVSASIEVDGKEVPAAYASSDFAPGMANGCGAIYESVVYWPGRCEEVAAKHFAGLPKGKNLGRLISSLDAGGGARVFLMPAGNGGCVSIKKEML